MDITKHNQAETALRESAERFRLLAESIPVLVWSACPDGTSDYYNSRFLEYLGKTKEEMLSWTWASTLHPDDQQRSIDAWTEAFTKGTEYRIEYRIRRADGQYRWHIGHALPLRNDAGTTVRWFGTCTDIDDRKRAEEALRKSQQELRLLTSQLLSIQEKERLRVARELHDELGQALTVVAIEDKLTLNQHPLKANCEQMLSYIDTVIENVRRLSWDLSPSSLEDLGLSSALRYLVNEICRNHNLQSSVEMDEIDHLFSPEVQINIYRIFQESLTNVVKHARASQVSVKISRENGQVSFMIRDHGRGFNMKQAMSGKSAKRSLGLTAINERVLIAQGSLQIVSRRDSGTTIAFAIPTINRASTAR